MTHFKLYGAQLWRSPLVLILLILPLSKCDTCPAPEEILPCRCSYRGGEIQIWCSYGSLQTVLDSLRILSNRVRDPIDEMIVESNNLPSLPGRTFDGLHVTRLMLRDNGLERVTSNWLASLENTLLELFIIEPRLRTLPLDALEHLNALEAVTLQGGIIKRAPKFSGLHKLRYIQLHSPVLMEMSPENFENLPNLEQLNIVGSPLLNKLDYRVISNLMKLRLLNISNCGLSWLHPKSMTNLPSLKELVLTSNRLADAGIVGRACRDLQSLQIIKLENNFIDRLLEGSFIDLPSLRELYLSGNLISEIHHGAFRNTPSLKVLDLSRNLIKRVSPTAFVYPSGAAMEELWLMDNHIYQVSEMITLFNALPRLRFLEMSKNFMEEIPFDALHGHPTLERLHLDENRIRRIPNKQIAAIPTLRELRLRNNSLTDFSQQGPCWNLPALKGLDLSQNKFRRLDARLLTYLPSLRSLDLSENYIDTIIADSFVGTLDLETLNISHNFISQIHQLTFSHLPKLFEIDASSNRLREVIPGLPTNVEYLRLGNNQIFTLPTPQSQNLNLPSLRLFDVSGNSIQTITQDTFKVMGRLQYLYLNENALQNLENGALNGLSSLEHLNIKNNRIRDFTNNYLKGLKSLKEINLDGNFVEVLNSDITRHSPMLDTLHLSRNRIVDISKEAFQTARKLQQLDLSHNHLMKVPEALLGLEMLEVLDLSHNQIQSLQTFKFNSLPSLTELRLGSNKVREIQEDTFKDLPKLGFLDLENNSIEMISRGAIKALPSLLAVKLNQNSLTRLNEETLVDLPELQSAELQYNRLEEISNHALVNVPHLALLNLSNNFLSGLERTGINELRSLEVLDVSHNRLSWVESRALNGMEWLVELKIDNNNICNINGAPFNNLQRLRVLSLRNNKMTTFSESAFQRLRNSIAVFDIDGNPLSCSCKMVWLQSWLKDSAVEGPRCADGTLFRDARLSRNDCVNSRIVEPIVPGCEAEFQHTPVDATIGHYQALSEGKFEVKNNTKKDVPNPGESEYFYDEYVEYQYEEVNGTQDQLAGNASTINYVQINTIDPETTTVSTHLVSGDTPTLYASPGVHYPRPNITNPGLGYEDLKKASGIRPPPAPQTQSGLTFFGIPLPSLSLGNLWKGTAGRSSDSHPGKVQFTGTRGKPINPESVSSRSKNNEEIIPPNVLPGGIVSVTSRSNDGESLPPSLQQGFAAVTSRSRNEEPPTPKVHQGFVAITSRSKNEQSPHNVQQRGSVSIPNKHTEPVTPPNVQQGGFFPMLPGPGGFTPMFEEDAPVSSSGWESRSTSTEFPEQRTKHAEVAKVINRGKIEPVVLKRPNYLGLSSAPDTATAKPDEETSTTTEDNNNDVLPERPTQFLPGYDAAEHRTYQTLPPRHFEDLEPRLFSTTPSTTNEPYSTTEYTPPMQIPTQKYEEPAILVPQATGPVVQNYNELYEELDDEVYPTQPRYLTDRTYESLFKSTTDFPSPLWNNEDNEHPPRVADNTQMDWYFQNYNRTNLQPFVGSHSSQLYSHSLVLIMSLTVSMYHLNLF